MRSNPRGSNIIGNPPPPPADQVSGPNGVRPAREFNLHSAVGHLDVRQKNNAMRHLFISAMSVVVTCTTIVFAEEPAFPDLFASSEYVFVAQVIAVNPADSVRIQQVTIIKAKEPPENVTTLLKFVDKDRNLGSLKEDDQIVVFLSDRFEKDGMLWGTLTAPGSFAVFPKSFVLPPEWILR